MVVAHDPSVSHCQLDASRRRHGPATLTCKPKRNLRDAFAAACTLNPATRTPSATGRAGERCTTAGVDSTHTQASCGPRQWLRCSATPPRRHAAIRRGANNHAVAAAFLQVDGRRHPQLVSTLPLTHTPARARKQPRQRPSQPNHPHPSDLPSQPRFSSLPPHTPHVSTTAEPPHSPGSALASAHATHVAQTRDRQARLGSPWSCPKSTRRRTPCPSRCRLHMEEASSAQPHRS